MITKDFKIDFEKKKISYVGKNKKVYSVIEFYSFLQDTFDEPENMQHAIPILAHSKTHFALINGWAIDTKSLKYMKGNLQTV